MIDAPQVVECKAEPLWEGRNLCILLPFYRTTNPATMYAVMAMWDRAKMRMELHHGDAMISRTRNILADRFLATGAEWSLWIDDDIIPPCGNPAWFAQKTGIKRAPAFTGLHSINRLMSHKKSLVSGLYFGRGAAGRGMFHEAMTSDGINELAHSAPVDLLRETLWAATGYLLVHRSVYLAIREKFPNLAPREDAGQGAPWEYFTPDPGSNKGEDQIFGLRARQAGHPSYVDLAVVCGHLGNNVWGPENTR